MWVQAAYAICAHSNEHVLTVMCLLSYACYAPKAVLVTCLPASKIRTNWQYNNYAGNRCHCAFKLLRYCATAQLQLCLLFAVTASALKVWTRCVTTCELHNKGLLDAMLQGATMLSWHGAECLLYTHKKSRLHWLDKCRNLLPSHVLLDGSLPSHATRAYCSSMEITKRLFNVYLLSSQSWFASASAKFLCGFDTRL